MTGEQREAFHTTGDGHTSNQLAEAFKRSSEKKKKELEKKIQDDFKRIFNAGLIGEKIKKFHRGENVGKAQKSVADLEKKLVSYALEQGWNGENRDKDIKIFCQGKMAEVFAENKLRSKKLKDFLAEEVCSVEKKEPEAEAEKEEIKEAIQEDAKKNENKPHFETKSEEAFEKELKAKNIKSREELMAYLKSLKNTYVQRRWGGIHEVFPFPGYITKVENVFNKKITSDKIEIEGLRDLIEKILTKPEKEIVGEDSIAESVNKSKTAGELLDYLKNLNATVRGNRGGLYYFPTYAEKVKKALEKTMEKGETLGMEVIERKVREILDAKETNDEARATLDYIEENKTRSIKWIKDGKFNPSLSVENFLIDLRFYGKGIVEKMSEDAKKTIAEGLFKANADIRDAWEKYKKDFEGKKSGKIEEKEMNGDNKEKDVVTFGSRALELENEEKAKIELENNKKEPVAEILQPEGEKTEEKEEALIVREKKDAGKGVNFDDYKDYKVEKIENDKLEVIKKNEDDLKGEVKKARELYAMKDYETTNLLARIKGKLGIKMENQGIDSTREAYLNYKNKVNELMSFQLEEVRGKGLDGAELKKQMGYLFKEYTCEEKTKLYEARTNARAEKSKGKFGEKIMQKSSEIINGYRRANWKYKVALGLALLAGGFQGVFAAGAGYGAMAVYRAFSGAVAGVGTAATLEAFYRRKEIKNAKKGLEKLFADNENFSNKDKIDALYGSLHTEINKYDENLKSEKDKARQRKLWGALVGVTIGSGSFSMAMNKLGIGHFVMGKLGYTDVPEMQSHAPSGVANHGIESAENLKAQGIQSSELSIEKGSNPWKTATEYYEKMGMSPKEANNAVGNLFEKYEHQHGAKVFDKVFDGDKMIIDENGSLEFPDKHVGYLPEQSHISNTPDVPEIKLAGSESNIEINPDDPGTHAKMMPNFHETTPSDINYHPTGAETVGAENHIFHETATPNTESVSHPAEVASETHTEAPVEKPDTGAGAENIAAPKTNITEIGNHMGKIIDGSDVHGAVDKYLEMEHQSSDKISQLQDYIHKKTAEISGIGTDWKRRLAEDLLSKEKLKLDAEKVNLEHIRGFRDDFSRTTNSLRRNLCNIFRVENWSDIKSVTVEDALKAHPEIADQLSGISHSEEEAIDTFTRRLAIVAASKK